MRTGSPCVLQPLGVETRPDQTVRAKPSPPHPPAGPAFTAGAELEVVVSECTSRFPSAWTNQPVDGRDVSVQAGPQGP